MNDDFDLVQTIADLKSLARLVRNDPAQADRVSEDLIDSIARVIESPSGWFGRGALLDALLELMRAVVAARTGTTSN